MDQYLEQNPEADFSNVIQKFGTPDEIAGQDFDEETAKKLVTERDRWTKLGVIISVAVIILIAFLMLIIKLQSEFTVIYQENGSAIVESRME